MESNLDVTTILKIAEKIKQLEGKRVHLTDTFMDGKPLEAFGSILDEMKRLGYITFYHPSLALIEWYIFTLTPLNINKLKLVTRSEIDAILSNK
jgi:hypothetical protein